MPELVTLSAALDAIAERIDIDDRATGSNLIQRLRAWHDLPVVAAARAARGATAKAARRTRARKRFEEG